MRTFITTIHEAKKELSRVYSKYKSGLIDSDNAKTKVYILRAIIEANFKYEIEQRIEELEKKAGL